LEEAGIMKQQQGKTVEVLIVGAGPTGLMMACQLALRSIHFRIIDRKDYRTNYSGALIIQARSVEIFQQMGIAQSAIQQGIIANEINITFNGKKSFRIPIKEIGQGLSKFPYLLMLEQSKTEQLLADFIGNYGYAVERNTELLRFTQENDGVTAILRLPDGKEDILKATYLVAADGGHSTVREQLAIPFLGSTHSVSLFVTDCEAEVNLPVDTICFSFSNAATAGFFPLTGGRWRVDGTISRELEAKETIAFEDIAENFAIRTRMKIMLYKPQWFSVFHSHQRYASSFQQNRCFLLGDAAHVHSPVGAQGMNTGLQDAYNLAWKLALVIQKKAKESLLDTYMAERKTIAKKVIRSTDNIFKLVTSQHFLIKTFRVYAVPFIMKLILPVLKNQKAMRRLFFCMISEIGIHYRKSSISQHASLGNFPYYAPKPGDRLPYILYNKHGKAVNIQENMNGTGFHLLVFAKSTLPDNLLLVAEKYSHLLSIETIPYTSETSNLYERFGIHDNGCYLIRPDMYIAYRSVKPAAEHFESHLQHYLIGY
jgi:2-polyprenyl-6-methoxyphenol hydroxylase-like FAD-dependent oxidoreductase